MILNSQIDKMGCPFSLFLSYKTWILEICLIVKIRKVIVVMERGVYEKTPL